ncbi:MAG: hypothetical protein AAGA37_19965 [Actinomycetota bacterium]
MNPSQIATATGMHIDSVRQACAEGTIPAFAGPKMKRRCHEYRVPTTWVLQQAGMQLPAPPAHMTDEPHLTVVLHPSEVA